MALEAHGPLVAAFACGIIFLILLHWYVNNRRSQTLPPGGLLLTAVTSKTAITGIESEERVHSPQRAQALLTDAKRSGGKRGLAYRDGSVWVVVTGPTLALQRHSWDIPAQEKLVTYFLRHAGPELPTVQATAATPEDAATLAAAGWEGAPNTALSATFTTDIRRFGTLPDALKAANEEPPAPYILYNGANDPGYYVVRTRAGVQGEAIITRPGLPGTLYSRLVKHT